MAEELKIREELSCTQKLRGRPVTHEEGAASIQRLINSHFHNANSARCTIPVRADDDDVVASDYAKECAERIARAEAVLTVKEARIRELETLLSRVLELPQLFEGDDAEGEDYYCAICGDGAAVGQEMDHDRTCIIRKARAALAEGEVQP